MLEDRVKEIINAPIPQQVKDILEVYFSEELGEGAADDITEEICGVFGYPLQLGEKLAIVKEGELPEVPVEIRENWPLHKRYYKMAQEEMLKAMSGKFFEVVRII